jgi:hypothetical protein
MQNVVHTQQSVEQVVDADLLRDLLDVEILLIGGGDVIQFGG